MTSVHDHQDEHENLSPPPLQLWTQAQRDYWERYVADLADALELPHIELYFEWGKSISTEDSANAAASLRRNRLRLAFNPDLTKGSPEEQRDTAVHELVHYHTARWRQLTNRLDGLLHRDAYCVYTEQIIEEEEQLVDRLTRLLAPHLPLPNWPVDDGIPG